LCLVSALPAAACRLFWWLPLFNFLVMLLTLAYQAPLQLLLPPRRPDPASRVGLSAGSAPFCPYLPAAG
jgi:hypothetical protein